MGKKEDAIAGLKALTEKTIENVKLVLNHYGFDSYERKSKVLEDMLNVHRDWDGIDRKTRFEMLAQYFIENSPKKEDKKEKIVTFKIPAGARETQAKIILGLQQLFNEEAEDDEDEGITLTLARRTKILKIYKMIKDFNNDELERIYLTLSELHKKYELSDEEKAFRAMCRRFKIDEDSNDLARSIFFAGLNFARNE